MSPASKAVRPVKRTRPHAALKQQFESPLPGVSTEISPADSMLEADPNHYYSVGQSALRCIRLSMLAAGKEDFRSILDFGSGYGRVLRVLRAAFPEAQLAACDIDPGATAFCAKAFAAAPFRSHEDPAQIHIDRKFDLVWCGTLLTNLDVPVFEGMLRLFHSLLEPGGMLIFTTHGPFCAERVRSGECTYGIEAPLIPDFLKRYDAHGFAYEDYPSELRASLGLGRYGITISKPSWVCAQLERLPDTRIVNYTERVWDNHQDSVGCLRIS